MVLSEIQKFEIIVKHNNKLSMRKIAIDMNINLKTVHKWILRYKKNGNLNREKKEGKLLKIINNL